MYLCTNIKWVIQSFVSEKNGWIQKHGQTLMSPEPASKGRFPIKIQKYCSYK